MNNQRKIPLYEALTEHERKKSISYHVPGHKYGALLQAEFAPFFEQILKIDATELSGLDDLHSPEGAILEAEMLLTELYETKRSFFLVNGSTVGNLAMIMAVCVEGGTVLVQRNCHKSVLHALQLAKVRPIFLEPEYVEEWKIAAGVSPETVRQAIEVYPKVSAIILTYPNYYGMTYELQTIIQLAHAHHIPVLVDEAHGAHLIVGESFPESALLLGADAVVHSAHKTLPAMTMGSFLHINSQMIKVKRVKEYLEIFQSSSPSYPIMASLDIARNYIATYEQEDLAYLLFEINQFKERLKEIPSIKVLEYPDGQGDPLKITIQSRCKLSGFELQQRFEEFGIFTELADPANVLFVLPLLKEGQAYPLMETAKRMNEALAGVVGLAVQEDPFYHSNHEKISELALPIHELDLLKAEEVAISEAEGCISAEVLVPYPPGIPLLLRGERMTARKLNQLNLLVQTGARFQGDSSLLKKGFLKVYRTT